MYTARYQNVEFVGGYQFWSHPERVGTRESIPQVLANPTFLDLVQLVDRYGGACLLSANQTLHSAGQIPDFLFHSNTHSIRACMAGQASQEPK